MCFYSVSLIPKGTNPACNCAACWFTLLEMVWHIQPIGMTTQRHRNKETYIYRHTLIHAHTPRTITFRKLPTCRWAKFSAALPVHLCLSSPPHLSSLWLPRTRRPSIQWDTIYHCRNNYWRHFIVRKFQAILSFISLFIFLLLASSFLLSCHPLLSLPAFHCCAFLHGSQWALLQVRHPLAQPHHCRLQHGGGRALYYILSEGPDRLFPLFLTIGSLFPGKAMANSFWYCIFIPAV